MPGVPVLLIVSLLAPVWWQAKERVDRAISMPDATPSDADSAVVVAEDDTLAGAYSVLVKACLTKGEPLAAANAFDQMLTAGCAPT